VKEHHTVHEAITDAKAIARFRAFVLPATTPDGCELWTGDRSEYGYGRFTYEGKYIAAHRFAVLASGRPIPPGLCSLHHCDNPPCQREDHLFVGTKGDNVHDQMAKDRKPVGERHTLAKLTEENVREILTSPIGCYTLAKKLDVSVSLVKQVRQGISWPHIAAQYPKWVRPRRRASKPPQAPQRVRPLSKKTLRKMATAERRRLIDEARAEMVLKFRANAERERIARGKTLA
jgi:hypothetical protein